MRKNKNNKMEEEQRKEMLKERRQEMREFKELEEDAKLSEKTNNAKIRLGEAYEGICEVIDKYMDLPQERIELVALWILSTYFHSEFSTFPFLFLNAMRGSGKTRLLRIISNLAKGGKGKVQTGISEAVLFRMPPGDTLVLDELESIGSKEKGVFREYLNACYKKGGTVERVKKTNKKEGEAWEIETFQPYKPIAMANIWGMDEVLGDRCIPLILEKSNNPAKTKMIEDFEENPLFTTIKNNIIEFSVVCVVSLRKKNYKKLWNCYISNRYINNTNDTNYTNYTNNIIQEEIFDKIDKLDLDGRNLELSFPLLIIASYISDELFEKTLKTISEIMSIKKDDEITESRDVSVYEFVSQQDNSLQFVSLKDLLNHFKVWFGNEEDWVNEKWLGKSLKRLNLVVDKKRMASGRFVMLNVAKAKEKIKMFGGKKDE